MTGAPPPLEDRVAALERLAGVLGTSLQPNLINVTANGQVQPIYLEIAEAPFVPVSPAPSAEEINAAIAGLPANGGTIVLPGGSFVMDQAIIADKLYNVTLLGAGSRYGGTTLQTNSTDPKLISARSTGGFRLQGVHLYSPNATLNGASQLDLSRLPAGQIDTGLFHITDCAFDLPQNAGQACYAINLQKSISGTIEGCKFSGGLSAMRGLFVAGDYCNAHTVRDCFFSGQANIPIVDFGGGCVIGPGNTFEPLVTGNAGAYFQDSSLPCNGLLIIGNWTGDVQTGRGAWFTVAGEAISVLSNPQITSGAAGVLTNGNCNGLVVIGNDFASITNAVDTTIGTHNRFIYLGNNERAVSNPLPALANWGSGSIADEAAGIRMTDDLTVDWQAVTQLRVGNLGGGSPIIYFGTGEDTALYRGGAAVLATDQFFRIGNATGCLINGNPGNETASASAGAASALPATPAGYLVFEDHTGTARKIPYYNT